jgi:hypothetical protein
MGVLVLLVFIRSVTSRPYLPYSDDGGGRDEGGGRDDADCARDQLVARPQPAPRSRKVPLDRQRAANSRIARV